MNVKKFITTVTISILLVLISGCTNQSDEISDQTQFANNESETENSEVFSQSYETTAIPISSQDLLSSESEITIFNKRKIEKIYDGSSNSLSFVSEYEYDEFGNEIKITISSARSDIKYKAEYEFVNEYDSLGNLMKKTTIQDGKIQGWEEYNSSGDIIRSAAVSYLFEEDGSTSIYGHDYEYDASGNVIRKTTCRSGQTPSSYDTYEYNDNGNLTKITSYDSYSSEIYWWEEYEYDSNNNLIRYIKYGSEGQISEWHEYEYNSSNNMIKDISYFSDGRVNNWKEYEYINFFI